MVVSEAATLARDRTVLLLEHAHRLDRASSSSPTASSGRARGRSWIRSSPCGVRLSRRRVDPALAGLRVLQPVHRQLALHRAPREPVRCGCSGTRGRSRPSGPRFSRAPTRSMSGGDRLAARGRRRPLADRACPACPPALIVGAGAAMLVWPLVWPSRYLAAPVWLGFIFLLDPINARLGAESLLATSAAGDCAAEEPRAERFLCGVLWEFWNYWSRAKWHYTVPIMENMKIFEMPLPGTSGSRPSRSNASRCTSSCARSSFSVLPAAARRLRSGAGRVVIAARRARYLERRMSAPLEREIKLQVRQPRGRARRRAWRRRHAVAGRGACSRTRCSTPNERDAERAPARCCACGSKTAAAS